MNSLPLEESINESIDLSKVPIRALNYRSYQLLSALLNKKKIFKSEVGYYRDWRGLFQALQLEHYHLADLENDSNPTKKVLDLWEKSVEGANLKELQNVLGLIDRWDALDDSNKLFYEDAEKFLSKQSAEETIGSNAEEDEEMITKDDTPEKKQFYDAFILFADADNEFATKIVERMEQINLKLCVKDRDLLAGKMFEHDAIMKLISARCRRLVVVISKEFLKSSWNQFFVMFAQAQQIEQKQRKIIPCVYERLELPAAMALKYFTVLDFSRSNNFYNFWDKLEEAIKARTDSPGTATKNQLKITETGNTEQVQAEDKNINEPSKDKTAQISYKPEESLPDNSFNAVPQQSINESLSSCSASETLNHVPTIKSQNAASSSSELPSGRDTGNQELKKAKWYKLGLSSSKSSLDGVSDRSVKKKTKWYKTSKKIATAM